MRLTAVGVSGSVPGPASPASCYLLEADEVGPGGALRTWRVVLDLGSGAYGPLQAVCEPERLDAVLLSHLHADHCLDTTALWVALRHGPVAHLPADQRPPRLPVWAPAGAGPRLARAYDLPEDPGMGEVLDVRVLSDRVPVRVGPLLVEPVRVRHPVEAYGLRVTGPAEGAGAAGAGTAVLAYTGDTDDCPALDDLAGGADLLLCEASLLEGMPVEPGIHLTGAAAGAVAARTGARRTVLTHVPPWTDADAVLAEARAAAGPGVALSLLAPGAVLHV